MAQRQVLHAGVQELLAGIAEQNQDRANRVAVNARNPFSASDRVTFDQEPENQFGGFR